MTAALAIHCRSSSAVTSLIAATPLAAIMTLVPYLVSSRAKGRMPDYQHNFRIRGARQRHHLYLIKFDTTFMISN